MKKISVVVPCFNVSNYLDFCMEHLLQQTIGADDIEIILVDDASTDEGKTWQCIFDYEDRFPDIVKAVRLERNMRQGGARNIGISYATGEFMLFCDADDWIAPDAMERLYLIAKNNDADVVEFRKKVVKTQNDIEAVCESGNESRCFRNITEEDRKKHLVYDRKFFPYGCVTKLYRTSMIIENQIGFAENVIFEEPSFTVPVLLHERTHYYLDETLYFYYQHSGSTMTADWNGRKWDNAKTWLCLVQDLENKDLLGRYYEEAEYLFAFWYLGMSMRMWHQMGYWIEKDEIVALRDGVLRLFPRVRQNKYLNTPNMTWDNFLLKIFEIVISEESTQVINQILKESLSK